MTDLEISKALALAIGWEEDQIVLEYDAVWMVVNTNSRADLWAWRTFDYRDEVVAFRVAERYNAFPSRSVNHEDWYASYEGNDLYMVWEDTPQKAIAMAVIGAKT